MSTKPLMTPPAISSGALKVAPPSSVMTSLLSPVSALKRRKTRIGSFGSIAMMRALPEPTAPETSCSFQDVPPSVDLRSLVTKVDPLVSVTR